MLTQKVTVTETLPHLSEILVLYIIRTNEPVSGYQIRKRFIEIANTSLSFGTLVPMLHRFERFGLAYRAAETTDGEPVSYYWHITPFGVRRLDSHLALLAKLLNPTPSTNTKVPVATGAAPQIWKY